MIARPSTDLLKKDNFHWTEAAFEQLKQAMSTTPILTLHDFSQPFGHRD